MQRKRSRFLLLKAKSWSLQEHLFDGLTKESGDSLFAHRNTFFYHTLSAEDRSVGSAPAGGRITVFRAYMGSKDTSGRGVGTNF